MKRQIYLADNNDIVIIRQLKYQVLLTLHIYLHLAYRHSRETAISLRSNEHVAPSGRHARKTNSRVYRQRIDEGATDVLIYSREARRWLGCNQRNVGDTDVEVVQA